MFIKLTRLDGKPIWFNRNYIVTVEPRKESGSLVVPLGDGLDYEVVETAERIVKLLGGGTVVAAELSPEVPGPTVTDEETELQGKKTAARKDAGRTAKKTAKGKSVAVADAALNRGEEIAAGMRDEYVSVEHLLLALLDTVQIFLVVL